MTTTQTTPMSVVHKEGSFVHPLGIYLDVCRRRASSKHKPGDPTRSNKRKQNAPHLDQPNSDKRLTTAQASQHPSTTQTSGKHTKQTNFDGSQPKGATKKKHSQQATLPQTVSNVSEPAAVLKSRKQLKRNHDNATDSTQAKRLKIRPNRSEPKRYKSPARVDPEIWFDDVPPALIAASREDQTATGKSLIKASSFAGPTRRIAIDCEFVGVGFDGKDNALARVSIVNQFGHVLLDTLVRPAERVTDYRTRYSGIRPEDLRPGGPARPFHEVHKEVAKLCQGRVLVGHSLGNDLKVLMLSHPRRNIRDTSRYRPFRALFNGRTPSLRALTERVLGVQVQTGEHDSVEDARAAMRLYTSVKRIWESGKKGRDVKALGLPLPSNQLEETPALQSKLDVLTEYESGLDPISPAKNPEVPIKKPKVKTVAWDKSRNRRCSTKRSRFLQKRSKRSRNKRFQSAQM